VAAEYDAKNMQMAAILRSTDLSKVVAQETVTTPAGTFRYIRHVLQHNAIDPTKASDTEVRHVVRAKNQPVGPHGREARGEAPAFQHKRGNWLTSAENSSAA
jgi:hypothetical protein